MPPTPENLTRAITANLALGEALKAYERADEQAKSSAWAEVVRAHAQFNTTLKDADLGPMPPIDHRA
jgi:hypothetical protein